MKSSQKEKTEYKQNYFFDTSALIKLYHHEEGTECVERIFEQETSCIIISELSAIEVYSGLARKLRMKRNHERGQRRSHEELSKRL